MAIPHLAAGQPIDVLPLGAKLATARSVALFKTAQIEVIRLALLAGKSFPSHRVAGEITIQCLEGSIEVTAEGTSGTLKANQLMYLAGGVEHDMVAIEDASVLVTISLSK